MSKLIEILRKLALTLEQQYKAGERGSQIDLDDLTETLLAIADGLDEKHAVRYDGSYTVVIREVGGQLVATDADGHRRAWGKVDGWQDMPTRAVVEQLFHADEIGDVGGVERGEEAGIVAEILG